MPRCSHRGCVGCRSSVVWRFVPYAPRVAAASAARPGGAVPRASSARPLSASGPPHPSRRFRPRGGASRSGVRGVGSRRGPGSFLAGATLRPRGRSASAYGPAQMRAALRPRCGASTLLGPSTAAHLGEFSACTLARAAGSRGSVAGGNCRVSQESVVSVQVQGVVARGKGLPVSLETIVVPDPGPGEARVKVLACGVCHTDLHYREGGDQRRVPVPARPRGGRHRRVGRPGRHRRRARRLRRPQLARGVRHAAAPACAGGPGTASRRSTPRRR